LLPGARATLGHPPTVYVREDDLSDGVKAWIAGLLSPRNPEEIVAILVGVQDEDDPADAVERTYGSCGGSED
jgi:hypothetical protein